MSFDATARDKVLLQWKVTAEVNVKQIWLKEGEDGVAFIAI